VRQGYYRAALSMKEMLLYEDANDVIAQGLKVEPGNADLKKLQGDVAKELAAMKAKERKGPDGVCNFSLSHFFLFSFSFRNVCHLLNLPKRKEMTNSRTECTSKLFDGTQGLCE